MFAIASVFESIQHVGQHVAKYCPWQNPERCPKSCSCEIEKLLGEPCNSRPSVGQASRMWEWCASHWLKLEGSEALIEKKLQINCKARQFWQTKSALPVKDRIFSSLFFVVTCPGDHLMLLFTLSLIGCPHEPFPLPLSLVVDGAKTFQHQESRCIKVFCLHWIACCDCKCHKSAWRRGTLVGAVLAGCSCCWRYRAFLLLLAAPNKSQKGSKRHFQIRGTSMGCIEQAVGLDGRSITTLLIVAAVFTVFCFVWCLSWACVVKVSLLWRDLFPMLLSYVFCGLLGSHSSVAVGPQKQWLKRIWEVLPLPRLWIPSRATST